MISYDFRDRYFQHILLGWMKFVAPLTPSSIDDMPHPSYNQGDDRLFDPIPGGPYELLWEIGNMRNNWDTIQVNTYSLLSKAWPTMWVWIQHIYRAHQDSLQTFNGKMDSVVKDFFAQRYRLFVSICKALIDGCDHDPSMVCSNILANYPGIFRMMADMWLRESADKHIVHGFETARLAVTRRGIHHRLMTHIVSACGSVEEFEHAACQRVERNMGQAQPHYDILSPELTTLGAQISREDPCTPAFRATSQRVATTFMQAWTRIAASDSLTSYEVERRDVLLHTCASKIYNFGLYSPQAYDRILDILERDFLLLLIKSIPLVRRSSKVYPSFTNIVESLFDMIICHATTHRKVSSSIGRWVSANRSWGNFLLPTSNPRAFDSWSRLLKLLDERENSYKSYKQSSQYVLMCANAEVSVLRDQIWLTASDYWKCGNGDHAGLRRCSACKILLYCSMKCQREHWLVHKALCNSMKGNVQGCVDLSYPNLHYLSRLIAFDMEERYLDYIASATACVALPGSVPFFLLDYVEVLDGASSIKVMDANDKKPWFPLSEDDNLYPEWRKLLAVSQEQLPRLLVKIPRGALIGGAQQMTAAISLKDGDAGKTPTIGIRWLHCQ